MNEKIYIGIDIGGTKTAISAGNSSAGNAEVKILKKNAFPTDSNVQTALNNIFNETEKLIAEFGKEAVQAIGISCGGLTRAYFDLYGEQISGGEVCARAEKRRRKSP